MSSPRVLIIAYDFPPLGAIGTMRTLRLVRELSRQGWDITVLTSSPKTYLPATPVDANLESQVPSGVRVIRTRVIRGWDAISRSVLSLRRGAAANDRSGVPHRVAGDIRTAKSMLRRTKDWLDAAFSIPDKESGWIGSAVLRGIQHMLQTGRPDIIYSSAPPWSGQVVALALAAAARRPWVADFRDPWARAPWRDWMKPFRQHAAAAFEKRVVGRADAVLFVTRTNLEEFSAFYGPRAAARFHCVPNGCDPAELDGLEAPPRRDEFVLLHAGTLYGARNPLPVVKAAARAIARGALDRSRFRLRFLGTASLATDLPAQCRQLGIEDVVEFAPRVTRTESLRELKSASALLLVQTGTTVSVPGKAYEYLAAGRPILALSEEGETADLVRASGIGRSVSPDDSIETVERALLDVKAMAERSCGTAPRTLFDGTAHAQTMVELLGHYARRNRHPAEIAIDAPVRRSGAMEETRQ